MREVTTETAIDLAPLVISAPFGNYVQPVGATATLGTFTALRRPGRVRRILQTVRYYPRLKAWVNRIGLRNPGVEWLAERVKAGRIDPSDKLVSIHGFTADDWYALLDRVAGLAPRPLGIELNMSCPNVGQIDWPDDLFERAAGAGVPVVVKVPPINYELLFERAWGAGLRAFHCCNTLPIPAGGLSGAPLKPVALQCIRDVLGRLSRSERERIVIIGGGGVRRPADVDDYIAAGAKHVAVGTKAMNPFCLISEAPLWPLIDRATTRLAAEPPDPSGSTDGGTTGAGASTAASP